MRRFKFSIGDEWRPADVHAIYDLFGAMEQRLLTVYSDWMDDPSLKLFNAKVEKKLRKMKKRKKAKWTEDDKLDFLIPAWWSESQATVVYDLLGEVSERIWQHYLEEKPKSKPAPFCSTDWEGHPADQPDALPRLL